MISIITASLNAGPTIEAAIASATKQGVPVQHIVIDGGSADRTIEICQANPHIDLRVVPGCSIYEAWNIGIESATGDIVMFLNADDELAVDALKTVAAAFAEDPSFDILAGRARVTDTENPGEAPIFIDAAALDCGSLTFGGPAINAMAFRRSLFQRSGEFPISHRLAGDRAFLLRLAMMQIPPRMARTDALLYEYKSHADSLTLHKSLMQRLRIATEHRALAAELLQARPSASVKRILRRWRRREIVAAAYHALRSGKFLTALNFMMKNLAMPLVSVIIPTFNRPATTRRAIETALQQTVSDLEIVIVDDASEPRLDQDLLPPDPRLRIIRHDYNRGAAASRNTGMREAKGDWITFLDSDDTWQAEKLALQLREADQAADQTIDPAMLAIATGWRYMNKDGLSLPVIPFSATRPDEFARGCWFCPGQHAFDPAAGGVADRPAG